MSGGSLAPPLEDASLPALAQALGPDFARTRLAPAIGMPSGDLRVESCSAQVLSHKPGQRCTIRYLLAYPFGGSEHRLPVVGKLYRRRRSAARAFEWARALGNEVFESGGPLRVPTALALLDDLGLFLQEYVEAPDLREALLPHGWERPLAFAAQWLARLHATTPLPGLKAKSLEHELSKVHRWCDQMLPHLPPEAARQLHDTRGILLRTAQAMPAFAPAMIHRDYYYANALWDGRSIWVLDLDQLSVGDPALDVGHFLAHLEVLAYRTRGDRLAFSEQGAVFLRSYLEAAPLDLRDRLPFYRAYTFLKLAATEVSRQRGEWRQRAQVFANYACEEFEGKGSPAGE